MRRALGLAGIAAVGAVLLTGCEKPTPLVAAFSGTNYVHTEALCWAFDGGTVAPGQCAEDVLRGENTAEVASLEVSPGDTIGISVDETIAEAGWYLLYNGQPLGPPGDDGQPAPTRFTSSYFRFPSNVIPSSDVINLNVVAGDLQQPRGVWVLRLTSGPA